jgi:hypothetical protein
LGMLVVERIAKIRRAYFAQNKPIKTISRELRVSRKVVRKAIRSQASEFRYQRSREPLPRIDPWRDQLDGLLLENEGKSARERLTLIRVFEGARALFHAAAAVASGACPRAARSADPGQELNAWLLDRCVAYAKRTSIPNWPAAQSDRLLRAERPQLVQITGPFDGFHATRRHRPAG